MAGVTTEYLNGLSKVSHFLAQRLHLHDATIESIGTCDGNGVCSLQISAPYKFYNHRFVELKEHLEIRLNGCVVLHNSIHEDPAGYDVLSMRISENSVELKTMVGEIIFEFREIQIIAKNSESSHAEE